MSFGGGDSPQNTTFQTQYTRDAPQIEAAKLGLMKTAQDYTRFGMNPWEAVAPDAKPGETGLKGIKVAEKVEKSWLAGHISPDLDEDDE